MILCKIKKNVNKQIISRKLQVIRKYFVEMRNINIHRKKNIAQGYSWNQNVNGIACRSTDLRTYCSCFIVEDERLRCIQTAPFLWSKSHGLVTQPTRISNKICMGLHGRVVAVFTERRWAFMAGCRSCSLGKRSVVKWTQMPPSSEGSDHLNKEDVQVNYNRPISFTVINSHFEMHRLRVV